MNKLLDRNEFRREVFYRDGGHCVFCKKPAIDIHHIMERRLFPDGGYYMNNGASVCAQHHLECEMTKISVEDVMQACGIKNRFTPPHLYDDQIYDKWGNPILPNGQRLKGDLFNDKSVEKILHMGGVLHLFTDFVKYPRTYHLPWSEDIGKDDRVHRSMDHFDGYVIVMSEKMDGENTTMYRDHIHARSVSSEGHPTRDWIKNFWSKIRHEIPEGWRICGENLYAKHSILYTDLPSYFMGFSIWNNENMCLSWEETLEWFNLLGIVPVPFLYIGIYDKDILKYTWENLKSHEESEGYVIRTADAFHYKNFKWLVAKFVRHDHVKTSEYWLRKEIEKNGLIK